MAAIWRDHPTSVHPPAEPPFAAQLRRLVESADAHAAELAGPHERRLLQRVRAALAAFEAGWLVLGEAGDAD